MFDRRYMDRLQSLFLSTLEDVRLERPMRRKVVVRDGVLEAAGQRVALDDVDDIVVVAIGKAAGTMAKSLAEILSPRSCRGLIVGSAPIADPPPNFATIVGGHPYPDENSLRAAAAAAEVVKGLTPRHLVFYLLSGGGSAACEKPLYDEISLDDLRRLYEVFVTCGVRIVDINVLRKHLSAVKGGRLAAIARPARQITLYVSDVPPEYASMVASGPSMPDESTVADCYRIAARDGLWRRFPEPYRRLFDERGLEETPKPGDPVFASSAWGLIADHRDAMSALRARVAAEGWAFDTVEIDDQPIPEAADRMLRRLDALRQAGAGPAAVLAGGEVSSPVIGDGRGGRNQAFVLHCVRRIADQRIAVLSAGTDGVDGTSTATGAVADGATCRRALSLGLDPEEFFRRSDSHRFFEILGDAIVTGPTGNNIRDLLVALAW